MSILFIHEGVCYSYFSESCVLVIYCITNTSELNGLKPFSLVVWWVDWVAEEFLLQLLTEAAVRCRLVQGHVKAQLDWVSRMAYKWPQLMLVVGWEFSCQSIPAWTLPVAWACAARMLVLSVGTREHTF